MNIMRFSCHVISFSKSVLYWCLTDSVFSSYFLYDIFIKISCISGHLESVSGLNLLMKISDQLEILNLDSRIAQKGLESTEL